MAVSAATIAAAARDSASLASEARRAAHVMPGGDRPLGCIAAGREQPRGVLAVGFGLAHKALVQFL